MGLKTRVASNHSTARCAAFVVLQTVRATAPTRDDARIVLLVLAWWLCLIGGAAFQRISLGTLSVEVAFDV